MTPWHGRDAQPKRRTYRAGPTRLHSAAVRQGCLESAEYLKLLAVTSVKVSAEAPGSRCDPCSRSGASPDREGSLTVLQGKWLRGIADELRRGPDGGAVSFVEHKTRHRPSTPGALQQDTARLQLMLYRALLAGLREMPAAQASQALISAVCRLCVRS